MKGDILIVLGEDNFRLLLNLLNCANSRVTIMARGRHLRNTTFRAIQGNSCEGAVSLFEFQRQSPITTMRRTFLGNLCCSARRSNEHVSLLGRDLSCRTFRSLVDLVEPDDSAAYVFESVDYPFWGVLRETRYYIVVQKPSFIRNHKVYGMEFKLNISNSLLLQPEDGCPLGAFTTKAIRK